MGAQERLEAEDALLGDGDDGLKRHVEELEGHREAGLETGPVPEPPPLDADDLQRLPLQARHLVESHRVDERVVEELRGDGLLQVTEGPVLDRPDRGAELGSP